MPDFGPAVDVPGSPIQLQSAKGIFAVIRGRLNHVIQPLPPAFSVLTVSYILAPRYHQAAWETVTVGSQVANPCSVLTSYHSRLPGTLPFAGYGIWFLQPRHRWLARMAKMQAQMGLVTFELQIPTLPPAALINDPKNLEFILKDTDLFVKGDFVKSNTWELFGHGILNADGQLWRVQRKAGLRFFSNSNLQHFIDHMLPPLLDDMHFRLEKAAVDTSIVDLQAEFLELTTRLMGKIAYDVDISPKLPFSDAFEYASSVTSDKFTSPLWRIADLLKGGKFQTCVKEVKMFGASLIESAQTRRSKRDKETTELASQQTILIDSFLDHISSAEIVADAAVNFLSAGRDTTAQSLAWTVYSLLRHPESMNRLVDSLGRELPNPSQGGNGLIPYKHLNAPNAFPYVQACYAEALRLNPAVPLEMKEATSACELPDGTTLPKGSAVIWMPYLLARSPDIWGLDAAEYRPERWLEDDSSGGLRVLTRSAFENPVFNAGPRMCIGKRMAEVLALKVLVEVCCRWEIQEVRGKGEIGCSRVIGEGLTAPILGGLPVKVRHARR